MYDAYLFDLDGTLYRGRDPIPGAAETVAALRARGARVRFLTNNSTLAPADFARKLGGFGIAADPSEVVTSAVATAARLRADGIGSAWTIGEPGLRAVLAEGGIAEGDGAVVVGLCRTFDYAMLAEAMRRVRAGAPFYATNPDLTFPVEGGGLVPGAGSLVAAVAACAGVAPVVVGKPSPAMVLSCLRVLGLPPERALVVGDRLDTDIACGVAAGCPTWLVLSGVESGLPEGQAGGAITALLRSEAHE